VPSALLWKARRRKVAFVKVEHQTRRNTVRRSCRAMGYCGILLECYCLDCAEKVPHCDDCGRGTRFEACLGRMAGGREKGSHDDGCRGSPRGEILQAYFRRIFVLVILAFPISVSSRPKESTVRMVCREAVPRAFTILDCSTRPRHIVCSFHLTTSLCAICH
jgi:hypothetical protein